MGIFNLYPLSLILALYYADFVVGCSALALCQNADIDFIGEDTLDCFVRGFKLGAGFALDVFGIDGTFLNGLLKDAEE